MRSAGASLWVWTLSLCLLGGCTPSPPEAGPAPPEGSTGSSSSARVSASPLATPEPSPQPVKSAERRGLEAILTLSEPGLRVTLSSHGSLRIEAGGEDYQLPVDPELADSLVGEWVKSPAFASSQGVAGPITLSRAIGRDLLQVEGGEVSSPGFQEQLERMRSLVPRLGRRAPGELWLAGRLEYLDIEGGVWRLVQGEGPDERLVLLGLPEGQRAGDEVVVSGRRDEASMGIAMAGPQYLVLAVRGLPASSVPPRSP